MGGVGGGCHGDGNTPLPTCLPGPNSLREGGGEGKEGGGAGVQRRWREEEGGGGGGLVRVKRQRKREEKRQVEGARNCTDKERPVCLAHLFSVVTDRKHRRTGRYQYHTCALCEVSRGAALACSHTMQASQY